MSGVVHILGRTHVGVTSATVTLLMVIGCVVCGVHLLRTPTAGAWAATASMSVVMMALHLPASAGGHTHATANTIGGTAPSAGHVPLVLGAIEFSFAAVVLWMSTRHRSFGAAPGTDGTQKEILSGRPTVRASRPSAN